MAFYQSPILKNRSQKINDLQTLKHDDMLIVSNNDFYDSPQIIKICQTNQNKISVYSWDKYIRVYKLSELALALLIDIKINDFIFDMEFINEQQILITTCQNQLIVINIQYNQTTSSSTQQIQNIQYSMKIILQNCLITKFYFFQEQKIFSMINYSNEIVFYIKRDKLQRLQSTQFKLRIIDIQQDMDELFVLFEDGTFLMFEIKDCIKFQLDSLPKFQTQIQNFNILNSYNCENRLLAIASSEGQIEIMKFKEWNEPQQQQLIDRFILNISLDYKDERITSINFLVFLETSFILLTNHGHVQVWDTNLKQITITYNFNYRVVCQSLEEFSKWSIIGFGYDWSNGIEGAKDVNYKSCIGFFDIEELLPFDLELDTLD